jgi:protein involved in temperature-dependent protein secretion
VKGIEPLSEYSQALQDQSIPDAASSAHTQIRAQITNALGRDLSQVVAAWSKIPAPLKAAILAIVNSSTASMEGES